MRQDGAPIRKITLKLPKTGVERVFAGLLTQERVASTREVCDPVEWQEEKDQGIPGPFPQPKQLSCIAGKEGLK